MNLMILDPWLQETVAIWAPLFWEQAKIQEIRPNYASTLKVLSLPLISMTKAVSGSNSIWSPRQCQRFWSCWRWGKEVSETYGKLLWSNKWRHHRKSSASWSFKFDKRPISIILLMPAFITEPLKLGFKGWGPSTTSHMMEESLSHRPPPALGSSSHPPPWESLSLTPWLLVGAMTIKTGFHGKNWIKPSYIFLGHRLSSGI